MTSLTGPGTISLEEEGAGKKSKKGAKAPKGAKAAAPAALPMVRVNLLPGEIAEKQALRRAMFKAGGVGALVIGLVLAVWLAQLAQLGFTKSNLAKQQKEGAALTTEAAGFREVNQTYDLLATRQAQLTVALGREVEFSDYLQSLSTTIPADTSLTSLNIVNEVAANPAAGAGLGAPSLVPKGIGTVTFSGGSRGYGGLVTWLQFLGAQKNFTGDYLTTASQDPSGTAVTFATQAALTPCALSGRFTVRPDPRSVVLRGEAIQSENTSTAECGAAQ